MKKILLVDDDLQILNALTRMFLDTDYELFTAENGQEALKVIESNAIDMVISDIKMPLLDGYQLLRIVKERYPHIIRIILSGYAEEASMYRAILHNIATLYLFKPWNNKEFLMNIEKLFTDDIILNSVDLVNTINEIGCNAVMPEPCNKLLSLIEEENTDAVLNELEKNTEISALLIQVAKSTVYGVMPNTVRQAVSYIGLHNLKAFLHFSCILTSTKDTENPSEEPELLWKHAYLTNRIFLFLYETFLHKQPPQATLFAGLLHNIGLIILLKGLREKGLMKKEPLTVKDSELELGKYNTLHQEIGAHFLDIWDLPFAIYEAALYHHRPLDPGIVNNELVSVIHIAQHYAWRTLGAADLPDLSPDVFQNIGVSTEDFEKRLARYLK
jgi:response regulator RpfG family c-di-GMP phosphodiesterase